MNPKVSLKSFGEVLKLTAHQDDAVLISRGHVKTLIQEIRTLKKALENVRDLSMNLYSEDRDKLVAVTVVSQQALNESVTTEE